MAALLILNLPSNGRGQSPIILKIWPDSTIGDFGDFPAERVRGADEAPTPDAKWITNVTVPTISVHRPAPEMNTGVCVLIFPGGGYWNLAIDKEGEEVAARMSGYGITSVVVKYRVPRRPGQPERLPAPLPLLDAQRAISLVRSRAEEWEVDASKIGVMGFSAGGHLAVMSAIQFDQRGYEAIDEIDKVSCRPDFAVPIYTGYILESPGSGQLAEYIRFSDTTPPMFIVHADDDDEPGAQPEQSQALYVALREADVSAELHIYAKGGHGFGVRELDLPVSRWPERFVEWLHQQEILSRPNLKH
ncbi:MAG: alpha/beta hydrolase [bacterium]|nr:alpha/beta hydrolase [bacterium]